MNKNIEKFEFKGAIMVEKLTKDSILNKIKNSDTAIISMNNGTMTTRNVSILLYDDKIWFQTDLKSKKMMGLDQFSRCKCSLLIDGINIDGAILETKGHPLNACNIEWLLEFKKVHPNTVNKYSNIDTEVLCCIDIWKSDEIRMWEYDKDHNPFIHTIRPVVSEECLDNILCGYTYDIVT